MALYIIRRVGEGLLVLIFAAFSIFLAVNIVGNPVDVMISDYATAAQREQLISNLGLDKPLPFQFIDFLIRAATGDFGRSFLYNRPVIDLFAQRVGPTLELAFCATVIALVVGIPAGVVAGVNAGRPSGNAIVSASMIGFSIPPFLTGLFLLAIFAMTMRWLPSGGRGETAVFLGIESSLWTSNGWRHMALPAINLALFQIALLTRLVRAAVRDTLGTEYVKFAHAKGLPMNHIVRVHVLKVIAIPVVTVIGVQLGGVIAGTIITETIFSWPGLGRLLVDSIINLDRPVLVAYILFTIAGFVTINLIVDVTYKALDPRVKFN